MTFRLLSAVATTALLAACAGTAVDPARPLKAEIRRTAYGVPHIKAEDYAGVGFGLGYASAQDNICEIAERVLTVTGERARYLGAGDNGANVASDVYHKRLIQTGELEKLLGGAKGSVDTPSPQARELGRGYVAGVSKFIRDTGAANITDPRCKGARRLNFPEA